MCENLESLVSSLFINIDITIISKYKGKLLPILPHFLFPGLSSKLFLMIFQWLNIVCEYNVNYYLVYKFYFIYLICLIYTPSFSPTLPSVWYYFIFLCVSCISFTFYSLATISTAIGSMFFHVYHQCFSNTFCIQS